jgi:peptidoglycan/xylan/chitin deacetylase (PgdA/CDA1 family)
MRAILTYHSIDASGSVISVSPEVFRAHMGFLASGAVRVVPLRELPRQPEEHDAVSLTFDDAFRNFECVALPLLQDFGLPATVFVVTGRAGGTNAWFGSSEKGIPELPLMSWDSLGVVMERGTEIGAHSVHHEDLTTLAAAALADNVHECAERLTRELGTRPDSFAYPYGRRNDKVETAVGAQFARACTTDFRPLEAKEHPLRLPRLDTYYFRLAGQLEAWGSAAFRRRLWLRAQGRRVKGLVTSARVTP